MGFLDMFRTKTLAEQLRDNKRHIDRAVRDLDRERQRLEQQEKKTLSEMKKMARLGQQTMKSQQAMAQAMSNVTKSMRVMNRQMNLPAMQKIMMEFERQGDIAEMKQEMMEDAMEDAMGADNEEAETDALVNQVFDEIGISFAQQLSPTPVGMSATTVGNPAIADAVVSDAHLKARLESLRRA